jgi:hypothetical protein
MAKAILASEQVEEFPLIERLAILALVFAELSRLPKDLFVSKGP